MFGGLSLTLNPANSRYAYYASKILDGSLVVEAAARKSSAEP
jgi:hypothetical protein